MCWLRGKAFLLSEWTVNRLRTRQRRVNVMMSDATLGATRTSANRERTRGGPARIACAAQRLGLPFDLPDPGQPGKASVNE